MKIAYCIICHKFTPVLRELVESVRAGGMNDIFVHVDEKSDITQFAQIADRVQFAEPRIDVCWGAYSQIEASLNLLKMPTSADYIALISGDTLPLRTDEQIKRYLGESGGREFVYELPLRPSHPARLKYKYPPGGKPQGLVARLRQRLKLLPRNPLFDTLPPLAFGSNWFVITPAFREYIFDFLRATPSYTEAFRHSHCGDELFFATLIEQSPFATRRDPRRYLYVDWQTGPQYPRTLDESDFGQLLAAKSRETDTEHYLFARKFSDMLDLAAYRAEFIENSCRCE
ncbi:MAG: beta-1,6-N-acetylglucosaminyltransferase [Rikenellaceae bacterium]|nr:beta-1,6-N-acetylglucosaminyltransferase [Rikenellaceae bacterium]MCL2692773.1 beta-1,6-N-acetylglucosaminyltransferase [Rikenellaceae bacterium]